MGAAAAIIGLIGAGASAYGSYSQGKSAKEAAEKQASIDKKNAAFEATKQKVATSKLLARQRAGYAKSGVEMEGTPLLVQEETERDAKFDLDAMKWGADAQAEETLRGGKARETAGKIGAGGSLLQGASSFSKSRNK